MMLVILKVITDLTERAPASILCLGSSVRHKVGTTTEGLNGEDAKRSCTRPSGVGQPKPNLWGTRPARKRSEGRKAKLRLGGKL